MFRNKEEDVKMLDWAKYSLTKVRRLRKTNLLSLYRHFSIFLPFFSVTIKYIRNENGIPNMYIGNFLYFSPMVILHQMMILLIRVWILFH